MRRTINDVCAEGMMVTPSFQPTPLWEHALEGQDCPHHLLLVAEVGEQVVGWCRLFPPDCGRLASSVELGIGVAAPWRRQGVGRTLIAQALDWACRRGLEVTLTTRSDNGPARRLFEEAGFTIDGCSGNDVQMVFRPRKE